MWPGLACMQMANEKLKLPPDVVGGLVDLGKGLCDTSTGTLLRVECSLAKLHKGGDAVVLTFVAGTLKEAAEWIFSD